MIKLTVLSAISLCFLAGCGDSSSGDTDNDPGDLSLIVIDSNNDSNGNGVQDDVDLIIDERYSNPSRHQVAMKAAKSIQDIVNSYYGSGSLDSITSQEYKKNMKCLRENFDNSYNELIYLKMISLKEPEQYDAYNIILDENSEILNISNSGAGEISCI